jgi:hypothetical protein
MKKYNYFYERTPITKDEFLSKVPENWEQDAVNGEYYWGLYWAIEITGSI